MHGMILHSGMIPSSPVPLLSEQPLILPLVPQTMEETVSHYLQKHPSLHPAPQQSQHSPCPHHPAATASFICAEQPFLCLSTLPSRARAASCNIFCATCILTLPQVICVSGEHFPCHVLLQTIYLALPPSLTLPPMLLNLFFTCL